MPGAPLYLVSACGTAEEFVAAFRRYADRTGLFVPSLAPLPAGRRGRIAVTLKDGGVMIEGEAEILQSSNKPTVLQGRPGMTIKFVEPDEPSKIIIGELERARLAMKVPSPSVPPRPAEVPAEPRAVVPPVGGRIDAQNALAECVVIGDPSLLTETAAPKSGGGIASGPNSKFVVPSIPGAPGSRPKTPSTPPEAPRAKTPSIPGEPTAVNVPPPPAPLVRAKAPSIPPEIKSAPTPMAPSKSGPTPTPVAASKSGPTPTPAAASKSAPTPTHISASKSGPNPSLKMTSIGFPAIREPAKPADSLLDTISEPAPKQVPAENPLLQTQHGVGLDTPRPPAPPAVMPIEVNDDEATSIGGIPPKKVTDPMPTTAPPGPPSGEQTAIGLIPAPPVEAPKPDKSKQNSKATSIGFPALRSPYETQPVGVVPPPTNPTSDGSGAFSAKGRPQQQRGKNPTSPPGTPRHPTPASPVPIVRMPIRNPAVITDEEKTDLSAVPVEVKTPDFPPEEQPMPQADDPLVDPLGKTEIGATTTSPRSGGMRASEIMAAIPTEDWTMTPDASAPTVLPSLQGEGDEDEPAEIVSTAPKGPPTGNWSISLDPEAGWSEPQKIASDAPPPPPPKPKTPPRGNPGIAVASSKALDVVQWDEKPTGIGEAKIEIDSTLMVPHTPMPVEDDSDAPPPLPSRPEVVPPPLAPMPPMAPSSAFPAAALMSPSTSMPVAPPPMPTAGFRMDTGQGFPPMARDVGPSGSVAALPHPGSAKNRRVIIIAGAAGVVILVGVLILMLSGGKKKPAAKTPPHPPEHAVVTQPADASVAQPDAAQVAVTQTPDAAVETPPPPSDGKCKVDIASAPTGADVYLAKAKIGTTPMSFELPCGSESVLTLKKPKFLATDKSITPVADKANKITVKLGVTMFSLKVTSTPSGATITIGGKSAGVTPATVKVPGGPATITLSKPGYATDTAKITAKANGQSHHVTLKKGGRH